MQNLTRRYVQLQIRDVDVVEAESQQIGMFPGWQALSYIDLPKYCRSKTVPRDFHGDKQNQRIYIFY